MFCCLSAFESQHSAGVADTQSLQQELRGSTLASHCSSCINSLASSPTSPTATGTKLYYVDVRSAYFVFFCASALVAMIPSPLTARSQHIVEVPCQTCHFSTVPATSRPDTCCEYPTYPTCYYSRYGYVHSCSLGSISPRLC